MEYLYIDESGTMTVSHHKTHPYFIIRSLNLIFLQHPFILYTPDHYLEYSKKGEMCMTNIAEKALKQLYDEYVRTGINDWQSIDSAAGKQLVSLGLARDNVQGDFMLTDEGIEQASS